MPETTPQIIGIEKKIIAKDFGVELSFHALRQYSVNFYDGSCAATYAGYASREAYEAGLQPLIHTTAQIKATPEGDVSQLSTWFALQLLAAASGHDFVGAIPVYAKSDDFSAFEQAVGAGGDWAIAEQAVGPGDEEPAA